MTDAVPALDPFDDELMFDEELPPAPEPAPPPPPAAKPKRASRKRAAEATAVDDGDEPTLPAPVAIALDEPAAPAPAPAAVAPPASEPSGARAEALPSTPARDRRTMLLGAGLALALLSSAMSLGGLLTVSRTVAAANAERAEAAEQRADLRRLVAALATRERPSAGGVAPPVAGAASGLTADDLNRALDGLRLALDKRQPDGVTSLAGSVQAGLSTIGDRLDRLDGQVARLQRPVPQSAGSRGR